MIRAQYGFTTFAALARLFPGQGEEIAWGISIVTAGLLMVEWVSTRGDDARRLIWTSSVTLAVTPLLGFRTDLSNLVAALPGMILILAGAHQRGRSMAWLGPAFLAAVMIIPWALASRPLMLGRQTTGDILFLFLPLLTVLALYWTRWWLLKPARTWLDEVRSAGG